MRKQHLTYLRRAIGIASSIKGGARMLEIVGKIKAGKTPVYQMIRDIVCDSRFYCVVEDDLFWKITQRQSFAILLILFHRKTGKTKSEEPGKRKIS